MTDQPLRRALSACQSCGACCAYSAAWPRFWTDTDAEIDRIPRDLVAPDGAGMACDGNRCRALVGSVGRATACAVYAVRPAVCRTCEPGDDACATARAAFGLAPLHAGTDVGAG